MDITDQILEQALYGDMQAFEHIVTAYERLVYNIALRLLNNAEDAEDATQDVFIKVYKNIDKCREAKALKSWICTITNNTCIDIIRKQKRRPVISLDEQIETEDGVLSLELPSDEKTPEQQFIEIEDYELLQKAIEKLPFDYRNAVVLRDIHNLSYTELAEVTKSNMGTIKSRLARGRSMLKNIYMQMKT